MSIGKRILLSLISLVFLIVLFLQASFDDYFIENSSESTSTSSVQLNSVPYYKYGFNLDSVYIEEDVFEPNQYFSEILLQYDIPYHKIAQIAERAKDIFSVRSFRSGKPYALIRENPCDPPSYFVYEPNAYRYILYPIRDFECSDIQICERPVQRIQKSASGTIDHSLWMSMKKTGHSLALIDRMEDALGWSVDFYHIQKGDSYKLIYEEEFIDGESVGIGNLHAAYFNQEGTEYYSIWYKSERYSGYFDRKGRSMKRAFLKSPVRYARISSRYNRNRFHPVLKRRRPHLGTDYAASYGTPIRAVADGRVTIASYTRGNGNYVKIRHDKVYETQYLHMSRFARGIHPGTHVKQGQTIGYVGATGLATGPHVCFRFWKNGRQVDHLRENLPPPEPMAEEELPNFFEKKDYWVEQLDEINIRSHSEEIDRGVEANRFQSSNP